MSTFRKALGIAALTILIVVFLLFILFRATLLENGISFAIGILLIAAVSTLIFFGSRLLKTFVNTIEDFSLNPPGPAKKTVVSQSGPPSGQTKIDIGIDQTDAVIKSAKEIVRAYEQGDRDFQNVFPTAKAPYETYFKWTTLDGADFSRAMLFQAPFDGTSLIGSNFNGASLEGASFQGASLRQSDLSWADLSSANLSGADLSGSNLSFATLTGADLSGAVLIGTIVTAEQLDKVKSLKGATLPDGTQSL